MRQQVQAGFLELGRTAHGRKLLAQVQLPKVVKADHGRDYAPLAALELERFVVSGDD